MLPGLVFSRSILLLLPSSSDSSSAEREWAHAIEREREAKKIALHRLEEAELVFDARLKSYKYFMYLVLFGVLMAFVLFFVDLELWWILQ